MMKISIIIPTINEENNLSDVLSLLLSNPYKDMEVIVVDGGSSDTTRDIAQGFDSVKLVISEVKSRAVQMNLGAQHATGDVLYFVHADARPPESFPDDIAGCLKKGNDLGCYRFKFDRNTLMLRFNAWWTRFPFMFCRGGDQTLFIRKETFTELGGFNEEYSIMEDFDFIRRAKKKFKFSIIPKDVIVSARKYSTNSYLRVNMVNLWSYWMFMLSASPAYIKSFYKKWLKPY
jgi:rSAM/selenodomain-associated transferase 2